MPQYRSDVIKIQKYKNYNILKTLKLDIKRYKPQHKVEITLSTHGDVTLKTSLDHFTTFVIKLLEIVLTGCRE